MSLRPRHPALLGALAAGLAALAVAQAPPASKSVPPPAPGPAAKARPSAPSPPTRLDVLVVDPAGRPVEGAFVAVAPVTGAYRPGGEIAPEKARTGFTSADGRVRLEALPPGPWNAWVSAKGFVTAPVRRVASGPLRVRLERGGVIAGVVREGDGGRPVAGARVVVESDVPSLAVGGADPVHPEAVTDAEGRFRLEGIGRAAVRLSVRAPGYARATRSGVRAGSSVELYLFPGATLSGSVRDDAGRPVRGALVRAQGDTAWEAPAPERTDESGRFVMAGVAPGEYTLVAREGGRAPGIAVVVVEPLGEASASLVLSDGGFVTGRIVDAEGRPLAGRARVEEYEGKALPPFASDMLVAAAGADGAFALGPLPLGSLEVTVSAPRHASRRVEAGVSARGRAVDLGDVALDPGLAIRGRVRDREGRGVEAAAVRATTLGPGAAGEGEAESGAAGRFEIGGLRPGRYEVTASATGYATGRAVAEAGGEEIEVVLDEGGTLTGRVADESGAPVEDAQVTARDESGTERWRVASGRSDEGDGRFALRDVPPGRYDLEVRAGDRGEASRAGVRVAAGRATDVGTVVLARGGVVEGVVVDGEGRGVPGATVAAEREANVRTGRRETQTGSSGAFELRGLPTGATFLTARHPSYAASPPVEVAVDPERETPAVRIVLVRGGRIEGRAVHRDGRPFTAGRVQAWPLDDRGSVGEWGQGALDAGGAFVLDRVPPGRVSVALMAFTPASPMAAGGAGATVLTGVDSREVEVRDGEAVTVDFALRDVVVAGRVTRGGEGEAGVLVGLMSRRGSSVSVFMGASPASAASTGPPPLAAVTREDGGYELLVFAPGPHFVQMRRGAQSFGGRETDVPDVERFALDLEIASTTVAGVVVERDTGAPLGGVRVSLRPEASPPGRGAGGGAETSPDGRFTIPVEPGEYRLVARAPDRRPVEMPLSVGTGGMADLKVEMEAGLEIAGRVLDAAGRPAPGHLVLATADDGTSGGHANSTADGTFRIGGLAARPYAVVAGSEVAGFGVRFGVVPGGEPAALTLRPAGRIALRVVDPSGRPVAGAYPRVESVDGARVRLPGRTSGPTDAEGRFDLASPPGRVEVAVGHESGRGKATAIVRSAERVPLTVVLEPSAGTR